jgi:hypothetical protein
MRAASAAMRGARRSSSTDGIWRSRSDLCVDATGIFQHKLPQTGSVATARLCRGALLLRASLLGVYISLAPCRSLSS